MLVLVAALIALLPRWCWAQAAAGSNKPAEREAGAPATKPPAPTPAAEPLQFDVMEFVVNGNSVLPRLTIEKAVYPFLGPRRTIKDVEGAREALERAYHDAGYASVAVDIPEQGVESGLVRLEVSEVRVDRVRVSGARHYSAGRIRAQVNALAAGEVPYFPQAQEQLAQLSRTPDRKVTPVLRPGATPGQLEIDLKVEDRLPLHGSIELNNRRSVDTEALRLSASLRYENLWQREHAISLTYQTSPQDTSQVRALFGSYSMPLWSGSDKVLALYAVKSSSSVSTVGGTNVLGDGRIFGARTIWPLPVRGNLFHSLTLGVDYKDFKEGTSLAGADRVNTPISYLPFLIGYNANIPDKTGQSQFGLTFNFAVRGLADNKIDCFGQVVSEFACKRFNARSNYAYLRAEASRSHNLPRGFALFGKVEGQYAGQALISNEQFAAGGAESVRGYFESEVTGDDGLRGSVELRSPGLLSGANKDPAAQLTLLAFFDGAALRVVDPLPSQTRKFRISSAGMGFRLMAVKGLTATLDLAWPLRDTARTQAGQTRVGFRMAMEF